jgi:hypothetical protein
MSASNETTHWGAIPASVSTAGLGIETVNLSASA